MVLRWAGGNKRRAGFLATRPPFDNAFGFITGIDTAVASFIAAFTNRLLTANFETASIINFNAGESAALANSRALGRSGVINLKDSLGMF